MARMIVAIDGPAGAGKSSAARALARRLGFRFLDTGAMYRAVAWHCLNEGVDLADAEAVAAAAVAMDLDQSTDPDVEAVRVGGTDVTEAIRGPEVTDTVSTVAVVIPVREELHRRQRAAIAAAGRLVAEGRDITTVVCPDADVRVLLLADAGARLRRRTLELYGDTSEAHLEATRHQVEDRDAADSTVSEFMEPAPGVGVVDSAAMGIDEVVAAVLALVDADLESRTGRD